MDTDTDRIGISGSAAGETVHGRWMHPNAESGLVSIIIPTYNRAGVITETLESVRRQTYRPLEVIIVDDGSSDDTSHVVRTWLAQCTSEEGISVSYLRQVNRGAPAARNLGLIESAGEFIQFLDSDDLLSPEKIELCVAALRAEEDLHFAYGPTEAFGEEVGRHYPGLLSDDPIAVLEAACVASVWTIMGPLYRREVCLRAGPWLENLSCWQDREYALRMLADLPQLRFVPGATSYYRLGHGPNIGADWERSERDLESIRSGAEAAVRAIEGGCGYTSAMRERLAKQFVNVGRLLGQLGRTAAARTVLGRAEEIAKGTSYARTIRRLQLLTYVGGFRLTNRCLALRARFRARRSGGPRPRW